MNLGISTLFNLNLGAITSKYNLVILRDLAVQLDNDCLQHEAPLLPTADHDLTTVY